MGRGCSAGTTEQAGHTGQVLLFWVQTLHSFVSLTQAASSVTVMALNDSFNLSGALLVFCLIIKINSLEITLH